MLTGAAFFFVPGIGPVLVAGRWQHGSWAHSKGAVAVGGLSAIGAALFSVGIPKDSVLKHHVALKANQFL